MEESYVERNKEIADLYLSTNLSMGEVGKPYGISRERVRQIVEMIYPGYHRPPKYHPTAEERKQSILENRLKVFWSRTKSDTKTGCLEWTGMTHPVSGYGICTLRGVTNSTRYVHRLAWILTNGEIPDGLWVLHRCDNVACLNINHLYLGTPADNIRDREERFGGIPWEKRDKTKTPRRRVSNETLT